MGQKWPWLKRYQHAWPVEAFAKAWLEEQRRGCRTWQQHIRRQVPRSSSKTRAQTRSHIETDPKHGVPQHTSSTRDEATRSVAPTPVRETQPAQASPDKALKSVRRFLASLEPPMEDITSIFIQGGVCNTACLKALIAMTERQQRSVLERLPLTVFQVQLICNALEEHRE
ncbi:hypothetical protein PHLGIDRAFT_234969 [Phlebiopsis gigantea 11061_1 CR5-6]|uniref:Uncharacterized protein n=1 Tax=Phlebiopsis gigantea (strain 11061_1 CR5-6) TaxID=745531 RepID=A0A0C3NFS6_PHLG1|nr:hypothetical protein PHLGIDRAFT_234969 [Phlebiopsis gigantea 11061_1 CR5-6]